MTTETKKKLRTHKDTIKYISWILRHCFARPSVMFLEFLAPDWPLQNPRQGLKASEGLYKIPTCSNLGCPPRFLPHVLDFVEASLVFNPCLGFCRGPHRPPKHTIPNLISTIQWYSRPSKTIRIIHKHPHEHMNTWTHHMKLPDLGSSCFVCSFQTLFGSFGWLLAFGARPVKTTRIIQNQPKSMTTETKKKLRTHKDTIKYISWILRHCFARPSVMFLEFLAPDWPLQNPRQGLKASEGLYKIPTCSNLGCPPRFLPHVLHFVEASLTHVWDFVPILVKAITKKQDELKCLLIMCAPHARAPSRAEMVSKIQFFCASACGARAFKGSRANQNHANPNSMKGHHSRHTWRWFKWVFVRTYCFLNVFLRVGQGREWTVSVGIDRFGVRWCSLGQRKH